MHWKGLGGMGFSGQGTPGQTEGGSISSSEGVRAGTFNPEVGSLTVLPGVSIPDHVLLNCIGRGAYGSVWLARNVMGSYRAVKIVRREDFGRDRPFTREFEGLLQYEPISRSHPNLMQILHVGRQDGFFYYVTELADDARLLRSLPALGLQHSPNSEIALTSIRNYIPRTLQDDLDRRRRLPVKECVHLATSLASALKHLHVHGLVHRDVKPSNVIFVHGLPKLADIGLVAAAGHSHSIVGTEGYLPPEGPGSPQADLYALGKLLYEISTGLNRAEYPRLPDDLRSRADERELLEFNEVLLRACAKDTRRRYHWAGNLLADLALLERGDSVRRLRRLERNQLWFKRLGIALLAAGVLVSLALAQSHISHERANRLLARMHTTEGVRHLVRGDCGSGLPWFVSALELDSPALEVQSVHRTLIASVVGGMPLPLAYHNRPGATPLAADLSPDGGILAVGFDDSAVCLWDTASDRLLAELPHHFPVVHCQFVQNGTRLLTVTIGQELCLWDLDQPKAPCLWFPQAVEAASDLYSLGLNATLNRVYLSKGRYCFARTGPLDPAFKDLTLNLRLQGLARDIAVHYQIRQKTAPHRVLYQGSFRDSPESEPFEAGRDDPPQPLWGKFLVMLEYGSVAKGPQQSGRVVWDNLRVREHPSGSPPAPWRMIDDFEQNSLSRWIPLFPAGSRSECRVDRGQLVLSSLNLPLTQLGWTGVIWREAFQTAPERTLEFEIDLVAAEAPLPMAALSLCRPRVSIFTNPERPFIIHDRWLLLSWWDGSLRVYDLLANDFLPAADKALNSPLAIAYPRPLRQADLRSDAGCLVVAEPAEDPGGAHGSLCLWDLPSGLSRPVPLPSALQATDACFNPEGTRLAVTHLDGIELLDAHSFLPARTLFQGGRFTRPTFSSYGARLAAVRDAVEILVWDLGDPSHQPLRRSESSPILWLDFSPDGRFLLLSAANGTVQLWDLLQDRPCGPRIPGTHAQFCANGTRFLVFGGRHGVWVYELPSIAPPPVRLPPSVADPLRVESRTHGLCAEVQGDAVHISTPSGRFSVPYPATSPPQSIAFTPDHQYVVVESADHEAWVWQVASRSLAVKPLPIEYDAQLRQPCLPDLPILNADPAMLTDLAAVLGQHVRNSKGDLQFVDEAERGAFLVSLKRRSASLLFTAPAVRAEWHRQMAEEAERAGTWDAARLHWQHVLRLTAPTPPVPGQPTAQDRFEFALAANQAVQCLLATGRTRWAVIPPRPAWTSPTLLNLEDYYTEALGQNLTAFRGLPVGQQTYAGIPFDVRGIIDLKTTGMVRIPIERRCRRIHFLHAANQPTRGNREPIGSYRLCFENAPPICLTLQNPDDLPPYTPDRFHEVSECSRTNLMLHLRSELACPPPPHGQHSDHGPVFLTRSSWDLPAAFAEDLPRWLELEPGPATSAPLVLAITLE